MRPSNSTIWLPPKMAAYYLLLVQKMVARQFTKTHIFCGSEIAADAVVLLAIQSKKQLGIGVSHGWTPATSPKYVSESAGSVVVRIDSRPTTDMYEEFSKQIGEPFDRANAMPFFLHHILGIENPDGYRLRVPLKVSGDGSIICAAEVPKGSTICTMKTNGQSSVSAAIASANRRWVSWVTMPRHLVCCSIVLPRGFAWARDSGPSWKASLAY